MGLAAATVALATTTGVLVTVVVPKPTVGDRVAAGGAGVALRVAVGAAGVGVHGGACAWSHTWLASATGPGRAWVTASSASTIPNAPAATPAPRRAPLWAAITQQYVFRACRPASGAGAAPPHTTRCGYP